MGGGTREKEERWDRERRGGGESEGLANKDLGWGGVLGEKATPLAGGKKRKEENEKIC